MIVLLLSSDSASDVVLNALALYFILTIDDEVASGRHVSELNHEQRQEQFALKSVGCLEFKRNDFQNFEDTVMKLPMNRIRAIAALRKTLGILNLVVLGLGTIGF